MTEHQQTNLQFQALLDELREGSASAGKKLVELSFHKFRRLAEKAISGYQLVRRKEETDDLLHNSMIRLQKALAGKIPHSSIEFYSFVATLIRNELIEMGRKHLGRKNLRKGWISNNNHLVNEAVDPETKSHSFQKWIEFHEEANRLEQKHKEVFDLVFYEGLNQQETADLLGISKKTVQRRWKHIKEQLALDFLP